MARLRTAYRPVIAGTDTTVVEDAREVPVWVEADVCVIGGGAAGLGAAMGAVRAGARKVILVERYGFCGGAAVAGMSGTICGLFASGTRKPEMIVDGFALEFYDRLRRRGGVADPWPFGRTYLAVHDPLAWKELADDMLTDAGVGILYHTWFAAPILQGRAVTHVVLENKNGRGAVRARAFIDASGDADLVHRAGGASTQGQQGVTQAPTMIFRMMNVDVVRAGRTGPEELIRKLVEARASGAYDLPRTHCYMYPSPRNGEYSCNMTRVNPPGGSGKACLSGVETDDLTFAEIEGRRLVREYERFLRDCVPGFEHAVVNDTGTQIGIRQTRSIIGKARLTNEDVRQARKFGEAAVTKSAWPIEDHVGGEVRIVYLENDFYEVPREALVPQGLDNVWVAGRCFSAEHEALASARVTAQCLEMGLAAGQAAALAAP